MQHNRISQLGTDWELDLAPSKFLWQIIKFGLWSIIAILLVWLVWQGYLLLRTYGKRWQRGQNRSIPFETPDRTPQLSTVYWVERSQTARIEGNYREAIFCLYQAISRLVEENVRDATLIQIYGKTNPSNLSASKQKWIAQGNTLIILGVDRPATAAPFAKSIPYRLQPLSEDLIEIETSRRYRQQTQGIAETILGDRYNAVVWSEKVGRGKVIYCTTPYLAANAIKIVPITTGFWQSWLAKMRLFG